MSKICPETEDVVLYLDCQDCDTKSCRKSAGKDEKKEERK